MLNIITWDVDTFQILMNACMVMGHREFKSLIRNCSRIYNNNIYCNLKAKTDDDFSNIPSTTCLYVCGRL